MNRDSLLKHSDLEEQINPTFRRTITNFESEEGPKSHNKLHLLNGVVVPCLLHMMGILFFLQIPHAVGETGWLATFLYLFFGFLGCFVEHRSLRAGGGAPQPLYYTAKLRALSSIHKKRMTPFSVTTA